MRSSAFLFLSFITAFLCTHLSGRGDFDVFGSGANQFIVPFTTIGNPGNADDTQGNPSPAGGVSYYYRISTTEISRDMVEKVNAAGGLSITLFDLSGSGGNGANRPATGVSWFEAARFVNWLNTSQGYQAAYNFDPSGNFQLWSSTDAWQLDGENRFRHRNARYWIPNADEWYKAAYYNPLTASYSQFPNGANSPPVSVTGGTDPNTAVYQRTLAEGPADISNAGGFSPYGVMGLGGNVWEWQETEVDLLNDDAMADRILRGGSWVSDISRLRSDTWADPTLAINEGTDVGFRIAGYSSNAVPEPSSFALLSLAAGYFPIRRWWQRRRKITQTST